MACLCCFLYDFFLLQTNKYDFFLILCIGGTILGVFEDQALDSRAPIRFALNLDIRTEFPCRSHRQNVSCCTSCNGERQGVLPSNNRRMMPSPQIFCYLPWDLALRNDAFSIRAFLPREVLCAVHWFSVPAIAIRALNTAGIYSRSDRKWVFSESLRNSLTMIRSKKRGH